MPFKIKDNSYIEYCRSERYDPTYNLVINGILVIRNQSFIACSAYLLELTGEYQNQTIRKFKQQVDNFDDIIEYIKSKVTKKSEGVRNEQQQ